MESEIKPPPHPEAVIEWGLMAENDSQPQKPYDSYTSLESALMASSKISQCPILIMCRYVLREGNSVTYWKWTSTAHLPPFTSPCPSPSHELES